MIADYPSLQVYTANVYELLSIAERFVKGRNVNGIKRRHLKWISTHPNAYLM